MARKPLVFYRPEAVIVTPGDLPKIEPVHLAGGNRRLYVVALRTTEERDDKPAH